MSTSLHSSLARIFADLIKADTVIDGGELAQYAAIRKRFGLSAEAERQGAQVTLAEALKKLSGLNEKKRSEILQECFALSVSDGFCAYPEALLLLAYHFCLSEEFGTNAEVLSVSMPDVYMDDNQVLFVESDCHDAINDDIQQHYRNIANEFRLVGFDFVYIPYIAEHYLRYNQTTFKDAATFLAPHLSENEINKVVENLSHITTAQFCNDQLFHRLEMTSLQFCAPSLLIKISKNYVGNKSFVNFLRVPVGDDISLIVRNIADFLKNLMNAESVIVPNNEEADEQFLYHGFYKQLFDMYTIQQGISSSLLIDFDKGEIQLPEAGTTIAGLRRKEKAFYTLLLAKSKAGGLNFNSPQSAMQLVEYQKRMKTIQRDYARIYALFGGDKKSAPDIENADIRRPMVSAIRKNIARFSDLLSHPIDYSIFKDENGNYKVPLSSDLIQIKIKSKQQSIDDLL